MKGFLQKGSDKKKTEKSSSNLQASKESNDVQDNKDTKGGQFSKTEQEGTKKVFQLIVEKLPEVLLSLERLVGSADQDEMCQCLINLAQATGTTFPMIKAFILDEFVRNYKDDPGSIMRGNCIASKLTKVYLQKIGRPYVKEIVGPFLQSMELIDFPLEVDPNKVERNEELEGNRAMLLTKIKDVMQSITSTEMVQKMPQEIKIIASYFAAFANQYAPEQFYPLVGGFLFLRYINPALISPSLYDLMPDGKTLPAFTIRNLILITKVLQNLSNNVEFGKKEEYMMFYNDFIRANTWKVEMFFKSIVSQVPQDVTAVLDPTAATEADFVFFHNILVTKKKAILQCVEDPAQKNILKELLDTITQYKHITNFLTPDYKTEAPATIRLTVEANNQIFEYALNGSAIEMQALVQKMMEKMTKHEQKTKKSARKVPEKVDPSVFGKKLEYVMEQQRAVKPHLKIPEFISDGITHLLLKGLGDEGIFRLSGDKKEIEALKQEIDKGEKLNLSKITNIHNLTGLIKMFLQMIPGSLLTTELYDLFIKVTKNTTPSEEEYRDQVQKLKHLVSELPPSHRDLLEALLHLLWQISNNSSRNLMSVANLGVVFGPTLLRNSSGTDSMAESSASNHVIELMITEYENLFKESIEKEEEKQTLPMWKQRIVAHAKSIHFMVPVSGGQIICSASAGIIKVWNSETREFIREINNGSVILCMIAVDTEIWVSSEKEVNIWDPNTGEKKAALPLGALAMTRVRPLSVWVASLDKPQMLVYDMRSRTVTQTFTVPDSIMQLEAIGDNVWGGSVGNIHIWDTVTLELVKDIPNAHKKKINAFLHVDQHVWSGSDDGVVLVWKKDTYEQVKKLETNSVKVKNLAQLNQMVFCCSWDPTIRIYLDTYELTTELKNQHTDCISAVVFVFSQKRQQWFAWTCSYDSTICIWYIPDPKKLYANLKKGSKSPTVIKA